MKTKEQVARLHGFIDGISIFSNTETIKGTFYAVMDEYAKEHIIQIIGYLDEMNKNAVRYQHQADQAEKEGDESLATIFSLRADLYEIIVEQLIEKIRNNHGRMD